MGRKNKNNEKVLAENHNEEESYVKSIKEYFDKVDEVVKEFSTDDAILVFRGEPQIYDNPGMPGIFRDDYLQKDPYFEKNILLEMKANKLTNGSNYLEMAIDAQHGGFPSRLLDVSYNSMVALYFACVSKKEKEKEEKEKDSQVLIYKMNKAYCPTASNVIDNYKIMLNNPSNYINDILFQSNYKLIDHIKVNSRIIAQQGALILFQGKNFSPIPPRMYKTIKIDGKSRHEIAKELKKFFGIDTSFVYPEIDYAIDNIKEKVEYIVSDEFSLAREIKDCFQNKNDEIEYILKTLKTVDEKNQVVEIRKLEKTLEAFRNDLENLIERYERKTKRAQNGEKEWVPDDNLGDPFRKKHDKSVESIKDCVKAQYLEMLEQYGKKLKYYVGENIEPCCEALGWRK